MSANRIEWLTNGADGWLPTGPQMKDALQFRLDAALGVPDRPDIEEASGISTSMRQGLGLIVLTALLAGLLPFLVNWTIAARAGTVLPLAQLARAAEAQTADMESGGPLQTWPETAATLAGLEPRLPGPLAAGLSAFGVWLNGPLNWLTLWIVYGLAVLLVSKLLGATTTLQHFYAATSYAYLPLLLLGLRPIPCLGTIASLIAVVWALVLYVQAVQLITRLDLGRSVLSVLLPLAAVALVGILLVGAFALSALQFTF